jgi:putative spermidine/putrescine transport system substrate-binding protein
MKKRIAVLSIVLFFSLTAAGVFAGGTQENKAVGVAPGSMDELIAAAEQEGVLVSYGLPDDWVNYGGILGILKDKYGIRSMDTDMGSGSIIAALKAERTAPVADATDLGFNFATVITEEKLSQPYKNGHWDEIPDYAKDPNGLWSAAYWGAFAFTVNTDIVKNIPRTWDDLLKPEYKNMVTMKDPRESGTANMMVLAAAFAHGGNEKNVQPGLDFFKKLKKAGNIRPVRPSTAAIQKGEAPIALFWDFDGLSKKYSLPMDSLRVVIPQDGTVAGMYIQFMTAGAPHPNAARLLLEIEYADEGQIEYAKGFVHPIRSSVKLPADVLNKFPPAKDYEAVHFVNDAEALGVAAEAIAKGWDEVEAIE